MPTTFWHPNVTNRGPGPGRSHKTNLITLPAVEDITRRELISSAFAAALLIACGDGNEEATPAAATRSITNKYGTYDIPTEPRRLVLMGNRIEMETATVLGLKPLAIRSEFKFAGGPTDYIARWVPFEPGAEQVFASEINLEYLASLQPDMILAFDQFLDGTLSAPNYTYRALSSIAPVVPVGQRNLGWREDLEQVADWLGREDHLANELAEYDLLRDDIKRRNGSRIARAKVAIGGFSAGPNLFLWGRNSTHLPLTQALRDLGGSLMPLPSENDIGRYDLSLENLRFLDEADGVVIFASSTQNRDLLLAHPLWPLIAPVQAGRAVVSPENLGRTSIYTVMECLRLWDQVYSKLA